MPRRNDNSPWTICAVLLLATLLNYMDRQTLAVTLPVLKQHYALGESRVGMIEGCFGFAFAAGSLLFGWLADRFGPGRLYPVVLAGWSAAGIATAFAGHATLFHGWKPPETRREQACFVGCCSAEHCWVSSRQVTGHVPC